jgi:heme/copper-type cytochrome/quinol oxidase subunit 2
VIIIIIIVVVVVVVIIFIITIIVFGFRTRALQQDLSTGEGKYAAYEYFSQ